MQLGAPFVELDFYYDGEDQTAFARLVKTLLELGATPAGSGLIHKGNAVPFSWIRDLDLEEVQITQSNIIAFLDHKDPQLLQVDMFDAVGIAGVGAAEVVEYVEISEDAARADHHPLVIYTDGSIFFPILTDRVQQREAASRQVYRKFLDIITNTNPSYAAITVEAPMKCPFDLNINPESAGFLDFFISENYVGASNLDLIRQMYSAAYIESVGSGLYISCVSDFNPSKVNLRLNTQHIEVGKIVASVGKHHRDKTQ